MLSFSSFAVVVPRETLQLLLLAFVLVVASLTAAVVRGIFFLRNDCARWVEGEVLLKSQRYKALVSLVISKELRFVLFAVVVQREMLQLLLLLAFVLVVAS